MTTGQHPLKRLLCPDCGGWFPEDRFVQHREEQHPPTKPLTLAVHGIESQAAFGTDPKE